MTRRVAIITGAASGIGRALAVAFAQEGTSTVIGTFPGDPHDPEQTAALVGSQGGRCVIHEVDVRDAAQVEHHLLSKNHGH